MIKIKELSEKYGVTTRTLRYYEAKGIIRSHRTDDYAYRMYDAEMITRLEQVLILRKMGISVKDIKRIFDTGGSEVILEVLGRKADDIDEEVALLHELKAIVLKFIAQIKQADLSSDEDVKMLYEKASEIEGQLVGAGDLERLAKVDEKLAEIAEARVISANEVAALKNFKAICMMLSLAVQEIENFCVPYDTLNPNWSWRSPEFKKVKWLGMKDMISACENAAVRTAEISAMLGEPRSELDVFKALVASLPEARTLSLEELAGYIAGLKSQIAVAKGLAHSDRDAYFDYIFGILPEIEFHKIDPEEALESVRQSVKAMSILLKDISAVMSEIGAAIDDPDSRLNRENP